MSDPRKQEKPRDRFPVMLDYRAAARLLCVAVGTLQAWVSTGRVDLPFVRYSDRTVRFIEEDLVDWIERRRKEGKEAYAAHVSENEGERE